MRPNLRTGVWTAAALGGVLLAGCEANGGSQFGGGGPNGGPSPFEHCFFPYGPGTFVNSGTDQCSGSCSVSNPGNLNDTDPATFPTINMNTVGGSGVAYINASLDDPFHP